MKATTIISAILVQATLAATAAQPIKAGLFAGNGPMGHSAAEWIRLTHASPDIDTTLLDAEAIRKGALDSVELFIMPGGSSIRAKADFGPEGIERIKEFMRKGGGYIGTCAGSSILLDDQINPERGIGMIPYGRVDVNRRMAQLQITVNEKGAEAFGMKPGDCDVWYDAGPVLGPSKADYPDAKIEVWATFGKGLHSGVPERMQGSIAVIGGTYGKGKLCATACHPEYYPFSYDQVKGMFRAVTGREVSFPQRRRSDKARTVGIYYHSAAGVDSARALIALDDNPDVDVIIVDQLAVSRGMLDHLDVLMLPNGDPANMKRYFNPFTVQMMTAFVERGGKAVTWGAGAMCLPKGGTVCQDYKEAVAFVADGGRK